MGCDHALEVKLQTRFLGQENRGSLYVADPLDKNDFAYCTSGAQTRSFATTRKMRILERNIMLKILLCGHVVVLCYLFFMFHQCSFFISLFHKDYSRAVVPWFERSL